MSSGRRGGVQSEINVTPLIDVLLVLLIIFLVVMPIMLDTEVLDIPREANDQVEPTPSLTVRVRPDLSFVLDDGTGQATVANADLATALAPRVAKLVGTKVVFVAVDPAVPWREAIDAMDRIRGVGDVRVALETSAVATSGGQ